jgi:hypothetical protein
MLENDREELKEEIRQLEDDRALKQANALLAQFKDVKGSATGLEQGIPILCDRPAAVRGPRKCHCHSLDGCATRGTRRSGGPGA